MDKYNYKSILTGFYGVCAEKGFTEGLINSIKSEHIPVRRLNASQGRLYFYVPCEFIGQIKEKAAFSGSEIKLTGSFGLLPFIYKNRDRVFLLAGILLTAVFIFLMSFRVWSIKVSGNEKLFSSEILAFSEELGLKKGCLKRNIDVEEFQKALLEKTQGKLIWASLNIEGMCAELEVRETKTVKDDIIGKPCNYIADFDGVIKIRRVYSGTPAVEAGSGVKKGDLLISGVVEYETGQTSFTEARGKLTAMHSVKVRESIPEKMNARKYDNSRNFYSVTVFNHEIKLGGFFLNNENCELTKETKALEINKTVLPFSVSRYKAVSYREENISDDSLYKAVALEKYLSKVRNTFKNSRVLSYSEKDADGYCGKYKVIDSIGIKKPILIAKNKK